MLCSIHGDSQNYLPGGQDASLASQGVVRSCRMELLILMVALEEGTAPKQVRFDLHWGYPATGRDYLDATCMLCSEGGNVEATLDYQQRLATGAKHSGDQMDDAKKTGHHVIDLDLPNLPANIVSALFILSAWNSPTISHYPNPSVSLYEPTKPEKVLSTYVFSQAANSQAVIMCALVRRGPASRSFDVQQVGVLCGGNAKQYDGIKAAIKTLPKQLLRYPQ